MTPRGYRDRLIEKRLDALMRAFGCVEITGPKWCGKTWTAMTRAASMTRLDDPLQRRAVEMDPTLALVGETPHLVDEWQKVPEGPAFLAVVVGRGSLAYTRDDGVHVIPTQLLGP